MAVDQDGHWTVIDELDLHVGAESAGFDLKPAAPTDRAKPLEQLGSATWLHRIGEAGASTTPDIPKKRELRHREQGSPDLGQPEAHFALLVLEQPQSAHLLGKGLGIAVLVGLTHADKNKKSALDAAHELTPHGDLGPRDPLNDASHG